MNRMDELRRIVAEHEAATVDGVVVDVQSANAILTVYEALDNEQRMMYLTVDVARMARIAWRLVQ